eukprot:194370-Prorocentrum_minimum.AAC.1
MVQQYAATNQKHLMLLGCAPLPILGFALSLHTLLIYTRGRIRGGGGCPACVNTPPGVPCGLSYGSLGDGARLVSAAAPRNARRAVRLHPRQRHHVRGSTTTATIATLTKPRGYSYQSRTGHVDMTRLVSGIHPRAVSVDLTVDEALSTRSEGVVAPHPPLPGIKSGGSPRRTSRGNLGFPGVQNPLARPATV